MIEGGETEPKDSPATDNELKEPEDDQEPPVLEAPRVIVKGSRTKRPRKKYDPMFFVNPLALVACLLGIFSLLMPWVVVETNYDKDDYGLAHYANERDLRFEIAIGLIVVGALFVLFIRAFGVVLLAGTVLFYVAASNDFKALYEGYAGSMSSGFYVGLVGGILGTTSLLLKPTFPISERFITITPTSRGTAYRVNALSIAAGTLGLLCIFLPWLVESQSFRFSDLSWTSNWSLFSVFGGSWSPYMMTAASLFIIGSFGALVSPVGGTAQLVGGLLYLRGILGDFRDFHSEYYGDGTIDPGVGLYLGLIASALAILSMFYTRRLLLPIGFFSMRAAERKTAVLAELEPPSAVAGSAVHPKWTIRKTMRLAAILSIVFILVVSPLLIAYGAPLSRFEIQINNMDSEHPGEAVIYIDDEIKWTVAVPPSSTISRTMKMSAGERNVGIDEAFPDGDPVRPLDGKLDWSMPVKVRPLIGVTVVAFIGNLEWRNPIGNISVVSDSAVTTVTFGGFLSWNFDGYFPGSVSWNDISIVLTDGTNGARWESIPAANLVSYSAPAYWQSTSAKNLGAVGIWLNVTDLAANGQANGGDYMTFSTGGGSFDPAVTYTIYVLSRTSQDLVCSAEF